MNPNMDTVKTIFYNLVSDEFSKLFFESFVKKFPNLDTIIVVRSNAQEVSLINNKIRVIYLDYEDVVLGIYTSIESQSSTEIFESNYKNVFLCLKMMDRLGRLIDTSIEKRFEMLFNHFNFLGAMVENFKIDLAIFQNMPHEIYDFVLYSILKSKNKKTFYFLQNQFEKYYEINESIENTYTLNNFSCDKDIDINISKEITELYENMRDASYDPFYMSSTKASTILSFNRKLIFLKRNFNQFTQILINKIKNIASYNKAKKFFNKIAITADLNKKYVLIPLHYQPELTTSPKGGIFVFQELMIQMISNHIPNDWVVYVKEHPVQSFSYGRTLSFYENISKMNRVYFIDNKIDSFNLMKNSMVVGIVTGTLGFKAICNQKPVFVFGEVFYKFAPGAYQIKNKKDLINAFGKVENQEEEIDEDFTLKYLEKIKSNFYYGYTDSYYSQILSIDVKSNVTSLVNNLYEKINNIALKD